MKKKNKEIEKPGYNIFISFLLLILILMADDWFLMSSVFLCIIYIGIIEYLKVKYYSLIINKGGKP